MPVFGRRAIDTLPTIQFVWPIQPEDVDWNELLHCLAAELEINSNNMVIVQAVRGSFKFKVNFSGFICRCQKTLDKIRQKIKVLFTPTSKVGELLAEKGLSGKITEVQQVSVELNNFDLDRNSDAFDTVLTVEDIDTALYLSEQLAILDQPYEGFLKTKSKAVTTCILHTFQRFGEEYVIENLTLVYNPQLYSYYSKWSTDNEEKILFHGTTVKAFDKILEENLQNFQAASQRNDKGWYGRGIYFSNSPQYCVSYTQSKGKTVFYLLCCLVKLGRIFHVTDKTYRGKEMRADADTHYAKVDRNGELVQADEEFSYEEFAVKDSNQICPIVIVGLRRVKRFLVWRDPKVMEGLNATLIELLKQQYDFNIYGCQTSIDALDILARKLVDPSMRCVVITNGDDDGEKFTIDCRTIRPSIPIIVYCTNVARHEIWAREQGGQPQIKITNRENDIFMFINAAFSEVSAK